MNLLDTDLTDQSVRNEVIRFLSLLCHWPSPFPGFKQALQVVLIIAVLLCRGAGDNQSVMIGTCVCCQGSGGQSHAEPST